MGQRQIIVRVVDLVTLDEQRISAGRQIGAGIVPQGYLVLDVVVGRGIDADLGAVGVEQQIVGRILHFRGVHVLGKCDLQVGMPGAQRAAVGRRHR